MSEVFRFDNRSYVEIDAGTVTSCTEPGNIGRFLYFVSIVQMGEGEFGVWDGESHSDAVEEARRHGSELSLPVIDKTGRAS
jgi:hypothetical protein